VRFFFDQNVAIREFVKTFDVATIVMPAKAGIHPRTTAGFRRAPE
jgi:hypothetical protein